MRLWGESVRPNARAGSEGLEWWAFVNLAWVCSPFPRDAATFWEVTAIVPEDDWGVLLDCFDRLVIVQETPLLLSSLPARKVCEWTGSSRRLRSLWDAPATPRSLGVDHLAECGRTCNPFWWKTLTKDNKTYAFCNVTWYKRYSYLLNTFIIYLKIQPRKVFQNTIIRSLSEISTHDNGAIRALLCLAAALLPSASLVSCKTHSAEG